MTLQGIQVKETATPGENSMRAATVDSMLKKYHLPNFDIVKIDIEGDLPQLRKL